MTEKVKRMSRWLPLVFSMAFGAACTEPNPSYDPDPYMPGECRGGVETTEVVTGFERPEKLDILLVVDASGDVADLQDTLAGSMRRLATLLERIDIDTHVAVTTTDATVGGGLARPGTSADGCAENDVVVAKSTSSRWSQVLACNVVQGADGDDFDQPLRVVDELLKAGGGGVFPRSDARLLIVVATKDDDCSSDAPLTGVPREVCPESDELLDVDAMVDTWIDGRVTKESIGLAVLGGPPSEEPRGQGRPVCSSTVGSVYPANRLYRATSRFEDLGFFDTACSDDFSVPLISAVEHFVVGATVTFCPASPLVHEPLDVVAERDGDQESVVVGNQGYVYLGATERCANGALQFASEALRGVEELALEYCALPTQ